MLLSRPLFPLAERTWGSPSSLDIIDEKGDEISRWQVMGPEFPLMRLQSSLKLCVVIPFS